MSIFDTANNDKSGTIDEWLERNADYRKEDKQGNPVDNNGSLILTEVESVDNITDEDFLNPTRNIKLPELPKNIKDAIGVSNKPVVIKKNVFERNRNAHKDLTPKQSREILSSALYTTSLYGQNQKKTQPYRWVVINTPGANGNNRLVLLEVNDNERKSQSSAEKMVKSGKTTSAATFQHIADLAAGYDSIDDLYRQGGQELVKLLINEKVIGANDAAAMLDGDRLSPSGQEFVEGLIVGYIFNGNDNTVRMLTAEGMGNVRKAVIGSLNALIANRTLGEYSLQQEIEQAIELCYRAHRDYGGNVEGLPRQRNLFTDEAYSENSAELAAEIAIAVNNGSSKLREALEAFNNSYADENGQADGLFGKRTREEALQTITNYLRNKNNGQRDSEEKAGDVEARSQGGGRTEVGGGPQDRSSETGGTSGPEQGRADQTGGQQDQGTGGERPAVSGPVQGLENYSAEELESLIRRQIDGEMMLVDKDEFKVTGIRVIGSRTTGTAREDSDLDVLVEYEGSMREDDAFNALNPEEGGFEIEGIHVDFNPVNKAKSGTIDEFLERNADYQKEEQIDKFIANAANPLSAENTDAVLQNMKGGATPIEIEAFTEDKWKQAFPNNTVDSPIGKIKIGENQKTKLIGKKRANQFGLIKPTLESPDVILYEEDLFPPEGTERTGKLLFVKTFKINGKEITHFESVTVRLEGLEINVSNHIVNENALKGKLQQDKIVYIKEKLLPNSSESRLAERQSDVPDLVPTQGNSSSESKDTQSSESPNENRENNELTDAQVKALAFVTGKSEEEIRAQQGGLPYDTKGEKTLYHPSTLRAAYESGDAAYIAKAEKAVGDYIKSSNSIEKLDYTAREFTARKKQAEKGSAEYRMDDFCEKKCKERIKQLKSLNPEKDDTRFRIIGKKGARRADEQEGVNTRLSNMRKAIKMEKEGISAKKIWYATGWERGYDGKWRYEAPDDEFVDDIFKKLENGESLPLAFMFKKGEEAELFKLYPDFKKITVKKEYLGDGTDGDYSDYYKEIRVNLYNSNVKPDRTLIHEIQHAIQEIEGFTPGWHPDNETLWLEEEFMIKGEENLRYATTIREEAEELVKNGEYKSLRWAAKNVIKGLQDDSHLSKSDFLHNEWFVEDAFTEMPYDKYVQEYWGDDWSNDDFVSFLTDVVVDHTLNELKNAASIAEGVFIRHAVPGNSDRYMRNAGETEARNADRRFGMSASERKKTPLSSTEDVPRDKQWYDEEEEKRRYLGIGGVDDIRFRLSNNNRKVVTSWLNKRTDLTEAEKAAVLNDIDNLEDAKTQLATGWWFAKGTIRLPEDMPKVEQAVQVATIAKVDPLKYSSPMELINGGVKILPPKKAAGEAAMVAYNKWKDGRGSENDVRSEAEIEAVNDIFNQELQKQIDGTLQKSHIYNLGMPGRLLLSTGFPNSPIELSASHLTGKAQKHSFDLKDVKNLVKALNQPVAVFKYGDSGKAQNVIAELQKNGKNFLIGVHFNQEKRGTVISDIRGIFPKDNAEWLNWITQDKALYLNKEKIQTLIDQQRINLAEVGYLDLDSVTKEIINFENPKLPEENKIFYREASPARAEAADIIDRYDNQDGSSDYPYMMPGDLVDEVEENSLLMAEEPVRQLVYEYRRLQEDNFEEGLRDFSGGEMQDLVEDRLIPALRGLAGDVSVTGGQTMFREGDLFGEEQPTLFGDEEMRGGVDNSRKMSIFASKNQNNDRTADNIQREGDRAGATQDRTGADGVRRKGDVFRETEGGGTSEENGASDETGAGAPSGRKPSGSGRLSAGTEGRNVQGVVICFQF